MDPLQYKNEIDRLSKEISTLKDTSECPAPSIWAYKYYFLIIAGLGALIFLIKPKYILTVYECEEADPQIVVSTKYFLICWLLSSMTGCLAYYIFTKYKKN